MLDTEPGRPLVLDCGCGTGVSTHRLAARHPGAWAIGVDRSAHRLGMDEAPEDEPTRASEGLVRRSGSVVLVRAEVSSVWALLQEEARKLEAIYLLYPNPYPKAAHLKRRWHAHPRFPTLLALGGTLELRSNWDIYVEEMAKTLSRLGRAVTRDEVPADEAPLSPFEAKYRRSGHALHRLRVGANAGGRSPGRAG